MKKKKKGRKRGTLCVCFVVLITRMELEQVSDVAEAAKPMTAERSSRFGSSSYCGRYSLSSLYTKNLQRGAIPGSLDRQ